MRGGRREGGESKGGTMDWRFSESEIQVCVY